jgi:hypothetical protein
MLPPRRRCAPLSLAHTPPSPVSRHSPRPNTKNDRRSPRSSRASSGATWSASGSTPSASTRPRSRRARASSSSSSSSRRGRLDARRGAARRPGERERGFVFVLVCCMDDPVVIITYRAWVGDGIYARGGSATNKTKTKKRRRRRRRRRRRTTTKTVTKTTDRLTTYENEEKKECVCSEGVFGEVGKGQNNTYPCRGVGRAERGQQAGTGRRTKNNAPPTPRISLFVFSPRFFRFLLVVLKSIGCVWWRREGTRVCQTHAADHHQINQ